MELKGAICFFRCCSKKYSEKVQVFLSFRLRVLILNHLSIKDSWCSAYETVVLSFDFHSSFTLSHSEELLVDLSKKREKRCFLQENGYFLYVFVKRFVLNFLGEEKIDILKTCVDLAVAWKSSCSKKVIAIE